MNDKKAKAEWMEKICLGADCKKNEKEKLIKYIVSGVLEFGGLGILWVTAGWEVAIAVFIIVWGHYIEKHS